MAALVLALLVLAGCSRPTAGEIFIPAPRNAYEYTLDVQDTLASYDLAFYTRIENPAREVQLKFNIVWKDPSDSLYRETVYLRQGEEDAVVRNYRTGMHFPQEGEWTLYVTVTPEVRGFRGLGLVWNSYYGTR